MKAFLKATEPAHGVDVESGTPKAGALVSEVNNIFREYAHSGVFLVLAILASIMLSRRGLAGIGLSASSFVLSAGYALTDELHQLFVPGRAFQLADLALDCAGILIGIGIVLACKRTLKSHM